MAPIERKPLPPPNANVTTLTEADRAEFLARANEVIDHYLNGRGSYWDEGTRKPLDKTLSDLRAFRSQVTASQQLADDPGGILDSVAGLIDEAVEEVKRALEDDDGQDHIEIPLPETNDRIIRAPRNSQNGISYLGRPPRELPDEASGDRFLIGRSLDRTPASALNERIAYQSEIPQSVPLLGLVSGKPMSFYPVQPPIWDFPESSAPKEDADDWLTRLLQGIGPR